MANIFNSATIVLPLAATAAIVLFGVILGVIQGLIQMKYQKKENELKDILKTESNSTDEKSSAAAADLSSTIVVREREVLYDNKERSNLEKENKAEKIVANVMEDLIKNYHGQALAQAAAQFWFSVVAALFGFLFIVFMVTTSTNTENLDIVIKTLPGAIISAVSALFFKQASETRQRATDLFDRLRQDNQHKEAIKLIESIADANLKSVVQAQLALKIGGVEVSLTDLHSIIDAKKGEEDKRI